MPVRKKNSKRAIRKDSTYKPEYCEQLIEYCAQGFSKTAFAGTIKTSLRRLYRWKEAYPEFEEAMAIAETVRVNALENEFKTTKDKARITAMIFSLKNACPSEWRDRHEFTGKDGGAVEVHVRKIVIENEKYKPDKAD